MEKGPADEGGAFQHVRLEGLEPPNLLIRDQIVPEALTTPSR